MTKQKSAILTNHLYTCMLSSMKRLTLYLSDKFYEWVRQKAFEEHISMSKFVQDRVLPPAKLSDETKNSLKEK